MKMNKLEHLLLAYETDARFPDVSGIEQIDMLLNRTELENNRALLSPEQQDRLLTADQQLAQQIHIFDATIAKIVDLNGWREKINPPPTHWWRYLDVLAYAWTRLPSAAPVEPVFAI
jgi:hypothetical protein